MTLSNAGSRTSSPRRPWLTSLPNNSALGFAEGRAVAVAADRAARELMGKRAVPTGPACKLFIDTMGRLLRPPKGGILGAKVNGFTRNDQHL